MFITRSCDVNGGKILKKKPRHCPLMAGDISQRSVGDKNLNTHSCNARMCVRIAFRACMVDGGGMDVYHGVAVEKDLYTHTIRLNSPTPEPCRLSPRGI